MTAQAQPRRQVFARGFAAAAVWPWYPTLIGIAFVASPYAEDPIEVLPGARLLLVVAVLGLIMTTLCVKALGIDRGGAAAAIVLIGLVIVTDLVRLLLVAAALGLIAVEATWSRRGTMKLRVPWSTLTSVLNTVLVILILVQVGRGVLVRATLPQVPIPGSWTAPAPGTRPDIFVIIADAHGRDDVLRERYDYDMQQLRGVLVSRGFEESADSYANHSLTRHSLAVLLNGRPLSELGQDMTQPADDRVVQGAMLDSAGVHMLQGASYEVSVVSSGYEHLPLHKVDRFIDAGPRTENEQAYMLASGAGRLIDGLTGGYVDAAASRVRRQLEVLSNISREESSDPQFVIVHLGLPHWPFVLNADCTLRPFDYRTPGTLARGWIRGDATSVQISADQTRCIDSMLEIAIPALVEARPDAVVLLVSDHGPEERLDWWHPDDQAVHDRLANLFWARTPGRAGVFPADVTLVNVLPILANEYLGTDIALHPNDLYLGPSEPDPHFVPYTPSEASSRSRVQP